MKGLYVLPFILNLLFVKDTAKRYINYILLGIATVYLILDLSSAISIEYLEFKHYEYLPFFLIMTLNSFGSHFFNDEYFNKRQILITTLLTGLALLTIGPISLIGVEFLYAWYLIYIRKKIFKLVEFEYLVKLVITICIIFQNNLPASIFEYLINVSTLILLIYYGATALLKNHMFLLFYSFLTLIIINDFAVMSDEIKYVLTSVLSTLLLLKFVLLLLGDIKKINLNKVNVFNFVKLFYELKVNKNFYINVNSPRYIKIRSIKSSSTVKKFYNDVSLSLIITLGFLLVFSSILLYGVNI